MREKHIQIQGMIMRDSNYLDGLIAGGLVAISFAGLILLIVSDLNNEAETEKNCIL
ncbi:hypothetical protein HI664_002824 [Escherichia coli]|uniref:hypothetical protein n=1 Tax=Escherichia coli TaxID=562 RepID=UPI0014825D0E|nr:hypothetical protein [Escherichia coli]EEZ6972689.1 hypothetical protein [Escherichia coli O9]EEC9594145.1 hypothetical protein [Escherichia coli]EFB0576329.1 hypothetical protein [Escherichia coli]EGE8441058.1 hypothetical protein [Escherichia coli]EJE9931000.1 hypothetical protein [Escherichia coli]